MGNRMGPCKPSRHSQRELAEDGKTSVTPSDGRVISLPRTTGLTKYELKEKFWSWSGDDYKVKDSQGNVAFKIDGKAFKLRDRMVFLTEANQPICVLREKIID